MNVPLLAGIGIAAFSICMLRHAMLQFGKALASQRWPSVHGELIEVRLWGKRNIDGEMKDADHLSVKYEYQVQDTMHVGTSATFFTLMYPETIHFAKSHPPNSRVEVYYNPLHPAESVLIPGLREDKRYSDVIFGSLGVITGVVIAVLGWTGVIG